MRDVLPLPEALADYIDRILAEAPAEEETASVRLHRDLWKAVRDALGGGAELQARYDRLLIAFHDATRRPLGVTPDSGAEFFSPRMSDEAEARRPGIATTAEVDRALLADLEERLGTRGAAATLRKALTLAKNDLALHRAARPSSPTTGGAA